MAGTSTLFVDDFYFSALLDNEELFPISDEKYAEELQFQEALMASSITSRIPTQSPETEDHHYPHTTKTERAKTKIETGESSKAKTGESWQFLCPICMDAKPTSEMFRNNTCSHTFCSDCIAKHVAVKIQDNISYVKCPELECGGVLHPEFFSQLLPKELFDRWENALCESLILGSQKFYCPFKDCSAMLVDDGGEAVTVAECPNCRRLFCAQCKVGWHGGMECTEFQGLRRGERDREDLMVMELAKNKKWRRCPHCKFYVEKVDGCLHIACRCGFHFCYGCGSAGTQCDGCR